MIQQLSTPVSLDINLLNATQLSHVTPTPRVPDRTASLTWSLYQNQQCFEFKTISLTWSLSILTLLPVLFPPFPFFFFLSIFSSSSESVGDDDESLNADAVGGESDRSCVACKGYDDWIGTRRIDGTGALQYSTVVAGTMKGEKATQ